MASIMKRGNTYSVRYNYKDHAGKPCKGWETFKTKAEAQERKITVEKELLDGTFLVPDAMTVEEMLYKWIPIQSSKHKWSPKTYTQSVAMVQNLIVPYIGKRKVQDLRTYDIEQFYATLSQTPCGQYVHGEKQELTENQKKRLLSSTSIHEVHTLLKTAFSYAVDWDLIHKSPTPREAPKVNTEERTIWDERTMLAALQTIIGVCNSNLIDDLDFVCRIKKPLNLIQIKAGNRQPNCLHQQVNLFLWCISLIQTPQQHLRA